MRKYLAYYETEWPANIAELTAIENKPFVGVCGKEVQYTVIPEPVTGPADNEIWYTSSDEDVVTPYTTGDFGAKIVSNTYENGKGIIKFDNNVTRIGDYAIRERYSLTSITIPNSITRLGVQAFSDCSVLTSITFEGTIEEWNNINKGSYWNYNVPATYVQCSDGQVTL